MTFQNRIRSLCLILVGALFLGGCAGSDDPPPSRRSFGGLVCMEYSRYTGPFPEDGSGRQVTDVAAMLVLNSSDEFLDYAKVECTVGNELGTFVITGLPPGGSAWVLEQDGLILAEGDPFMAQDCEDYIFRSDVIMSTDYLDVQTVDDVLTVTNRSDKALKNVAVYYKTVHTDGRYFGGITYLLEIGDLSPGQTVTKQAGHFSDSSRIVRYSFQES